MKDIVDSMLKKQAFGMDDYNPKAVVKDLLPVHTHVRAKSKRRFFTDEAITAKNVVPASVKYQTAIDWKKDPVSRNYKFNSDKRTTQAMQIEKDSKPGVNGVSKTTPGPAAHNGHDGWRYTNGKVGGTMKIREDRITFVQERRWFAN